MVQFISITLCMIKMCKWKDGKQLSGFITAKSRITKGPLKLETILESSFFPSTELSQRGIILNIPFYTIFLCNLLGVERHKAADYLQPCWMHNKWITLQRNCKVTTYRYSGGWEDWTLRFLIFILTCNTETPRSSHQNTETIYLRNKTLIPQNTLSK